MSNGVTKMTDSDEAIRAYLARGGKITRAAPDDRTLTEREIYQARRGNAPTPRDPVDERHIGAPDHLGRRAVTNGYGEFVGYA